MKSSFELLAVGQERAGGSHKGLPGGNGAAPAVRWQPPSWSPSAQVEGAAGGASRPLDPGDGAGDRADTGSGGGQGTGGPASRVAVAATPKAGEARNEGTEPRANVLVAGKGTPPPSERVRARRWLTRARRAAHAWLERARAEAEQVRSQAWKAGYAAGQAAAQRQLAAEAERLERQWQERCHQLEQRFRQLLLRSRDDVLELALSVARQVAGEHLAVEPQSLWARIEEGLAKLAGEGARVLVHPDRVPFIQGRPLPPGVRVSPDASLQPGDFRIESPRGEIDGRVDVQVCRVGDALRAAQGQVGPDPGQEGEDRPASTAAAIGRSEG